MSPPDLPSRSVRPLTWSPVTESNRRPSPYHGDALPTELTGPVATADGDELTVLLPCRCLPARSTPPHDRSVRSRLACGAFLCGLAVSGVRFRIVWVQA